jgi:hypothetical protein
MQAFRSLRIGAMAGACVAAMCLNAQAPANEAKGMPPRSTPTDYQAQAQAGSVTIGAEFMGHGVPTPDAVYSTEDYVVVEAGFYGPPAARLKLTAGDFTLKINKKKSPLASEPTELVLKSLKDPNWIPPEQPDTKSKSGIGTNANQDNTPPPPPQMPMELRHVMNQHVQKAVMLEGDRPLPQAGLLFFSYHGKVDSIRSLQLIYNGAAGSATLSLHP